MPSLTSGFRLLSGLLSSFTPRCGFSLKLWHSEGKYRLTNMVTGCL